MDAITVLQLVLWGAVVGLILAAPIGPINIEIVRRGIQHGFVHGWFMGVGALTADTIYAMAIVTGFARFAGNEHVRVVLYLAGAAMMAFIGVNSLRSAVQQGDVLIGKSEARRSRSYITGFMMAAFNPLGIVYWLTVGAGLAADAVTRFGSGSAPILVTGVTIGIFLWVTTLSVVAQISRRFVTGPAMRIITALSGVLLIGFALWFIVSGVRLLASG